MKRFTETEIWDKEWFMKLSPKHKCLLKFIFDKCDNAGVWSPNWILATACVNDVDPCTVDDLLALGNQVEVMPDGKVFVPDFIEFQYGRLSEDCKPHLKVINLLKKYNLYERVYIPYTKGMHTLQEKEEEKEEEKERTERGSGGKQNRKPNLRAEQERQTELKKEYDVLVAVVKNIQEVKEQKIKLAEFITVNKPHFIEPYCDLWNITIQPYKLSQVESISDGRLKKFKVRVREPAFDFLKILQEIRQSDYLQGKTNGWKADWDWIFENDTNYLKIIEGKYRNTTN